MGSLMIIIKVAALGGEALVETHQIMIDMKEIIKEEALDLSVPRYLLLYH